VQEDASAEGGVRDPARLDVVVVAVRRRVRHDKVRFQANFRGDVPDPGDGSAVGPQRPVPQAGEQDPAARHAEDLGGAGRLGAAGGPLAALVGEHEEVRLRAGADRLADERRGADLYVVRMRADGQELHLW
jgi:hypothetical protein